MTFKVYYERTENADAYRVWVYRVPHKKSALRLEGTTDYEWVDPDGFDARNIGKPTMVLPGPVFQMLKSGQVEKLPLYP